MTPLETAESIAFKFYGTNGAGAVSMASRDELAAEIHRAILRHSNADLERIRSLSREIEHLRAGSPLIVCDAVRTSLRAWNPIRKCYAQTDLIHMPSEKDVEVP